MQIIMSIMGMVGVLGLIIGFPLALFFSFRAHGEQDPMAKKKEKKKALGVILGPIILIILSIIMTVIVGFVTASLQ